MLTKSEIIIDIYLFDIYLFFYLLYENIIILFHYLIPTMIFNKTYFIYFIFCLDILKLIYEIFNKFYI